MKDPLGVSPSTGNQGTTRGKEKFILLRGTTFICTVWSGQGHGLVDRILLATPLAFLPTLTEMEAATDQLSTEVVSDFSELFENINGIDENVEFTFAHEGKELLREKMDQFVAEVNEAIRDGKVPPKSKTPDLIPRIACALHVFNSAMEQLLAGVPSSQPDTMISKTTLENAASFVHHLETQKEILCQVINRKHENFHFSFITFIAHTFFLLLLVETRPCSIRYLQIS